MFFLFAILHVVPPLIAVILYERLRGYKMPNIRRAALYLIFAFFITVAGITVLWLLGWTYQVWIPNSAGEMRGLTYILVYAFISFGTAVVLPHTICLLRAKAAAAAGDEEKESTADNSEQEVSS